MRYWGANSSRKELIPVNMYRHAADATPVLPVLIGALLSPPIVGTGGAVVVRADAA